MINLEIKQLKRYYHFIALKGNRDIIKKEFFKNWNISETKRIKLDSGCIIFHMTMTTDTKYYRGADDNLLYKNTDSDQYIFDIIVIEYSKIGVTMVGFPFKKLTVDLISSLVTNYKVLSKANFIKVDMSKLIRANNKHTDLYHNENHFWLGGVFITMTGDSFLSTVKLVGDKPLESDIYKNYFKERLSVAQNSGLEKCILKSKVIVSYEDVNYQVPSTVHIDKFGNFRLYIHNGGRNLLSLSAIFEFLDHLKCLVETPNSPVHHILNNEE